MSAAECAAWSALRPLAKNGYMTFGHACLVAKEETMRSRPSVWLGILIGSTIAGLIPELWGEDAFSYTSLLFSGAGAFVGLWIGFRISS